ncbi:MAG: hypothetical protein ABH864_05150 [archaeon]
MITAFQLPEELDFQLREYSRKIEGTKSQVLRLALKKFLEAQDAGIKKSK